MSLVEFIVKVYAPVWFSIKKKPSCEEGSRHLLKLAMFSRYLSMDLKTVVDECIKRNAFFAHTENLLLAMLSDDRIGVRKLAIRRIMSARHRTKTVNVRNFEMREFLKEPTVRHFAKFMCHTQAVERAVKIVTEASLSVCSAARGDGLIHSKLSSRSRNPSYTSKKAYNI